MVVRGDGLSATMSKYLIDEIEKTSNIVVEPSTQVVEAVGEERLEELKMRGPQGEYSVPASSLFVFIGAAPGTGWLPDSILRDEKGFLLAGPDLRIDGKLAGGARTVPAGVECSRGVCGRRCTARISEAGGLGRRRGIDCSAVCPPVPGGLLRERERDEQQG